MKSIGVVLIAIGVIMMVYTGFSYVTTEKVVDIGPIEINKEKDNPVSWSPIVGGVLLLGGVVIVTTANKK